MKKIFLLLVCLCFIHIHSSYSQSFTCHTEDALEAELSTHNCGENVDFIPAPDTPLKIIDVVLHVMQKEDPGNPQNFQDIPEHRAYLSNIIDKTNSLQLAEINPPLYGGPTDEPYVVDTRIRLALDPDDIYFIPDNVGWDNNGAETSFYVFDNHSIDEGCKLNVFFIENNDSGGLSGVGQSSVGGIVIDGFYLDSYQNNSPIGPMLGLFGHELGHVFSLGHAWLNSQFDRFPDIHNPQQVESFCNPNSEMFCSNNFMSTSQVTNYLSPLQIGGIYKKAIEGENQSNLFRLEYDPNATITITEDETWDIGKGLTGDVIVTTGNTLTIICKLLMPSGGKIIVQPGAKLEVLDGGHITSRAKCGQMWQGIVVQGISDLDQYVNTNTGYRDQGEVYLEDALIENALEAISLYDVDSSTPLNTTGGIVRARRTQFKDNSRSVHFKPYTNHPSGNISYFMDNCIFEITTSYHGGPFEELILLDGVNNILFRGGEYRYFIPVHAMYQNVAGIRSMDAGFKVLEFCYNGGCTSFQKPFFSGVPIGIHATSSGSSPYSFIVDKATFTGNLTGVFSEGVNNVQITRNIFNVGRHNQTGADSESIGVDINTGTSYTVEKNTLKRLSNSNTNTLIGTLINETGDDFNRIYKNRYEYLTFANLSNRDNVNEILTSEGLKYFCNLNINNEMDFAIPTNGFVLGEGVSRVQGSIQTPTGNFFSVDDGIANESDISNHGEFGITYFYFDMNSNHVPDDISDMVDPVGTPNPNTCLSIFDFDDPEDPIKLSDFTSQFEVHKPGLDSLALALKNLIDGGSSPVLLNTINSSFTNDGPQLKADLLTISPYLSKASLLAVADRTDILSHTDIYDIMMANPNESRQRVITNYLETKSNPIPTIMVEAIRNQPFPGNLRASQEMDRMNHYQAVSQAVDFIVKHYLQDSTGIKVDSLDYWLSQKNSIASEYQRIDLWLAQKNTAQATTLLNDVSLNYSFSDKQLTEYTYWSGLKNIQMNLINQGLSWLDMDSSQLQTVISIADNSEWIAGQQARNLLNFAYGHDYQADIILPIPQSGLRLAKPTEPIVEVKQVYAFPNPASTQVTFHIDLKEEAENTTLEVYNGLGTLVFVSEIPNKEHFVDWQTVHQAEGVYFYVLKNAGEVVDSGQQIINH